MFKYFGAVLRNLAPAQRGISRILSSSSAMFEQLDIDSPENQRKIEMIKSEVILTLMSALGMTFDLTGDLV